MRRAAWALVAAVGMAACSGGAGEVAPVSLDPVVSTTRPVPATTVPPTTEVSTTMVDTTTPDTPVPTLTGPVFSDALGVKVDTAPGVNTPGDTRQLLPEGLYVHIAWTADPNDQSVFTVQPDDIPILEAYANAIATYYAAALSTMSTEDPSFRTYFVDGGVKFDDAFAVHRRAGEVTSIGTGVVLRPYVLADRTTSTSAVVLDCFLSDEAYVPSGTRKTPESMVAFGQVATLALDAGEWRVALAAGEPQACV